MRCIAYQDRQEIAQLEHSVYIWNLQLNSVLENHTTRRVGLALLEGNEISSEDSSIDKSIHSAVERPLSLA